MPASTAPVARLAAASLAATLLLAACDSGPATTPPVRPGASATPREVNVIARDYTYVPSVVGLVPGETILLHVLNGGLETHEAIIGDAAVQDAWEVAEAATAGGPPGPTPLVSVTPDVAGVRIVVRSGERVDLVWAVPIARSGTTWSVGCHIHGHLEKGMIIPIRWAAPNGGATAVP